jgi:hypothetical protein
MALIKQKQIQDLVADLASKLDLAGGTLTGDLILNGDPVGALEAATKQYVDAAITSQVKYRGSFDPTAAAGAGLPVLDTITSVVGDMYTVTVAGIYTFSTGSANLEVGDVLIAESNGVLNNASDWTIVNKNLDASSIKSSYESNADTNAFTDAEKTQLSQTTGVNTNDELTASTTVSGISESSTVTETNTGTDASRHVTPSSLAGSDLQLKVNGVEALADVTDTINVEASGALMDSEIANLADVKAFDPADYSPASAISAVVIEEDDVCPVTAASVNFTVTLGTAPANGLSGISALHINGVGVSAGELISVSGTTMTINVPYAVDGSDVVTTRYF